MDDATAETVLSLQLEDLDGILAGEEATEEIGEVTDQRLAVTLYRDQLRERVSSLADRRMSLSIGSAVWQDGVLLTTSRAHEFAATRDRIRCATSRRRSTGPMSSTKCSAADRSQRCYYKTCSGLQRRRADSCWFYLPRYIVRA